MDFVLICQAIPMTASCETKILFILIMIRSIIFVYLFVKIEQYPSPDPLFLSYRFGIAKTGTQYAVSIMQSAKHSQADTRSRPCASLQPG
ncbi:hypothetical protein CHH27_27270 [Labrenzia sp. VG12]|nr:hypothetical protein CHH27_27270 [Labrenzia sp. VG12]